MAEMETVAQIKPKNTGQKQIFDNPILEKLTRTHIAVPITIFVATAVGLFVYGVIKSQVSAVLLTGLLIFGFLLFTLVEYMVHRHVFHMITNTKFKEKIQYNFHGVHHEYPKDKGRLAMPPLVSMTIATLLVVGLRAVIGDYTFGFLPGFLLGYASYLFVHYAVHAFRPPENFLKVLWVNHGIHHYKNDDLAFGVSSPLWDWIFRTLPEHKK